MLCLIASGQNVCVCVCACVYFFFPLFWMSGKFKKVPYEILHEIELGFLSQYVIYKSHSLSVTNEPETKVSNFYNYHGPQN